MPKIKKLLMRANCPVNEYWDADLLLVCITEDSLAKLLELREKAIAFLKTIDSASYGKVEIESPIGIRTLSGGDYLGEEIERELDDTEAAEVPSDFEPPDDAHVRTELHVVVIFPDGGMWLQATSKDSADYVEAELDLELLTEGTK